MDPMLTLMQIAALVVGGMCHALLGSVKVPLARRLAIDEARVGGLVSLFGFAMIPNRTRCPAGRLPRSGCHG